jgi:vacuolar-type H+-ATPase subunit I/STV1
MAKHKSAQALGLEHEIADVEQLIKEKDSEIESLQTEKELQAGGEIKELSADVDELGKAIVKMESELKSKKDGLKSERKTLEQVSGWNRAQDEVGRRVWGGLGVAECDFGCR